MNQQKSKLFRNLFATKQSFRKFKRVYSSTPLKIRLKTIETAQRIKSTGPVQFTEVQDGE